MPAGVGALIYASYYLNVLVTDSHFDRNIYGGLASERRSENRMAGSFA